MKTKKTLFDITVFMNNIKKTWTVSAVAVPVLYLTMILPIMMNVLSQPGDPGGQFEVEILTCLGANFNTIIMVAVTVSALMAVILFSYLQRSRAVSFYHSLPISREGLLFTNFVSALTIMYLPNVVISLVMFIQVKIMGYSAFSEIMVWLLVLCVEELYFFTLAVLFMMLCGNEIVSVIAYGILVFGPKYVVILLNSILTTVTYGYELGEIPYHLYRFIPSWRFEGIYLKVWKEPKGEDFIVHHEFWNLGSTLAIALAVTAVMLVIILLVYKKRRSETAGDLISARWFKPVAAAGVAIIFAIVITSLLASGIVDKTVTRYSNEMKAVTVASLTVVGFIGYFAVKLIAGRNKFRPGKSAVSSFIFACFMVILGLGVLLLSDRLEKYTPNAEDVESARFFDVVMGPEGPDGTVNPECVCKQFDVTDKDTIARIIELNRKAYSGRENWLLYGESEGYENVTISYILKDTMVAGNTLEEKIQVTRTYSISRKDMFFEEVNSELNR